MFNRIMKLKNKKGLSEVIAISIFILLAIISLSIVWASINNLTAVLSPIDCTQARIEQPIIGKGACYNSETKDVELILSRRTTSDIPITSMEFTITFTNRENLNYDCGPATDCETATILKIGETKTYFFNIEDNTGLNSIIVGINDCSLLSEEIIESCESQLPPS